MEGTLNSWATIRSEYNTLLSRVIIIFLNLEDERLVKNKEAGKRYVKKFCICYTNTGRKRKSSSEVFQNVRSRRSFKPDWKVMLSGLEKISEWKWIVWRPHRRQMSSIAVLWFHCLTLGDVQGGSNMTGTDLCVNLATSVPVIFEPPCIWRICSASWH